MTLTQANRLNFTERRLLYEFLQRNKTDFFTPHGMEYSDITRVFSSAKKDQYVVVIIDEDIAGYGMLRGYDAGYEIPTLGIIIDEKYKGTGLSKLFMHYLEQLAKMQGSKKIKLTVYKENLVAVKLYEKLGYNLAEYTETKYIGTKEL